MNGGPHGLCNFVVVIFFGRTWTDSAIVYKNKNMVIVKVPQKLYTDSLFGYPERVQNEQTK